MSSGWAVNVKESSADKATASKTYYVRVSGRHDAEAAVRRFLGAPGNIVEARLPVQSTVFDALDIPAGRVQEIRGGTKKAPE
jgi:hypothetical protein